MVLLLLIAGASLIWIGWIIGRSARDATQRKHHGDLYNAGFTVGYERGHEMGMLHRSQAYENEIACLRAIIDARYDVEK